MIAQLGFSPDADQTTPGIVADCTNLVPYQNGMEGAPTATTPTGVPALASTCQGAGVVTKLDDTRRVFACAQTKIYELVAGAWVDRSRGVAYTGTADTIWSIAQFGDATLMANRADVIQRSTAGAFADVATAPKAKIIFSVGAFVMALNVNDGTDKPDGWACSAAYDDTSWTASIATQATNGRLVATSGALTAGARLGEYAIAYKLRSIYIGQYVGSPTVWNWVQAPGGEAGCIGQNALCDVGGVHFFVGEDNFWMFDGTRPQPVGDGVVRQWFFNNSSQSYRYKTVCTFDRITNRVWIFYASKDATSLDSALVYHVLTKQWGKVTLSIEATVHYISPGATIDGLTGTIDTLPDVAFDSQYWLAGGKSLSVFNTSHQLQVLVGLSSSSSLITGIVGDDDNVTELNKVQPRFATKPTSATMTPSAALNSGDAFIDGSASTLSNGKFDARQSGRWHKANMSFVGPVQITHNNLELIPVGGR